MTLSAEIARYYGQGKEVKNRGGWLTCCPIHSEKTPSLSVTDKPGDDVDVDVYCHVGCDWKAIKDQFRADNLLPQWAPEKKNLEKHTTFSRSETPPNPEPEPAAPEKESYIWKQAKKDGLEHAVKYFATRAITIDPLPVCLKWNSYTDKKTTESNNMIVAAASKPGDDKVVAVQRLFIDMEDYHKTGAKMHGPCEGRGVWFDRKGDKSEIVIGEGIETTLSVIQATGKNSVAALSTAGMKGLIIPEETEKIFILVDSDPVREKEAASTPGQKAAMSLAKSFEDSRPGRSAYLVSPDDSCFSDNPAKLDFNDLLKADPSGESIRERIGKAVAFKDMVWAPPSLEGETSNPLSSDGYYPPKTIAELTKMNKEYAAVLLGGDFRIAKEGFDHVEKKHTLSFLKITSLYSYYANCKVGVPCGADGDIEYRELAKVWMTWDGRRTYDDVVFDPSGREKSSVYNLFKGFPLTPKQGDWSKMRKHIFQVICNSNSEHFDYVMAWMARAVQDPGGDKPGVALVLKGGKGIGKGVFANYFGAIFGEAFLPIADSESFTGKFNMHLSKSLVVFLDEAVWGGDKRAEGKLKQLITEPTIMFEPKGIDSMALRSFINVIIASNEDWVVPATGDERRYCVLQPSEKYQKNTEYFGAILKEQRGGGSEAMMYDLLQHDYQAVDLRLAPITEGLVEQVQESLPNVWEFWHSLFDRGYVLSHPETGKPIKTEFINSIIAVDELWPNEVYRYEVYTEYTHWCKRKNERYPRSEQQFWISTWKIWPGGIPKRRRKRGDNSELLDVLNLPVLKDARKEFTKKTKVTFDEADDGVKETLLPFNGQF